MKKIVFISAIVIFLVSCGTQKRIQSAVNKAKHAKETAATEKIILDSVKNQALGKLDTGALDSSIADDYIQILSKLTDSLNSIEQTAIALEIQAENKKNFKGTRYTSSVFKNIVLLDSFNVHSKKRERIYAMIREAVNINSFNLFNLAAFFEPGIFRVPPSAINKIEPLFITTIDTMAYLSNKYADVPHTAKIVFIGFADESSVKEGTILYNDLMKVLQKENPSRQELNFILSDLRARELVRNMKLIMSKNLQKFTNSNSLKIGYVGYGKGESYPSKTITNYTPADERRRIVLCYWAVLPDV